MISSPRNQLLFDPIEPPRHSPLILSLGTDRTVETFVWCGQIPPVSTAFSGAAATAASQPAPHSCIDIIWSTPASTCASR